MELFLKNSTSEFLDVKITNNLELLVISSRREDKFDIYCTFP